MIDATKVLEKAKINAQSFSTALRDNPSDVINRLFFAARNGAISHLLRGFEQHFRSMDMDVRASWEESSFPGGNIMLVLHDKRTGEHARRLAIARSRVHEARNLPSDLVYALQSVQVGDYYRGRIPQAASAFDQELGSAKFQKLAGQLVSGANWPFEYESHSSF